MLSEETKIINRYGVRYYTHGNDMGLKLQGLAAKVAKLEHDAEFEAAKLDAKIEGVAAKMPGIFSGAHGSVDKLAQNVGDIEGAFSAIQSVTNGAPDEKPQPITTIPVVNVIHDDTGIVDRPALSIDPKPQPIPS